MKNIIIKNVVSSGFDKDFNSITALEIDDKPFSEGGFGKIYHCQKINNQSFTNPQVIKIFKDNGQGSAAHSYKTISGLQEKILQKKHDYEALSADFLEQYPAFFGAPQFVFIGELDGEEVRGYSANNLNHFGYICFTDAINNGENRSAFLNLPTETIYAKAYHLARAFSLLNEFAYIHADFKTDNFFVSLTDARCALIDFDSGAIIQNLADDPYTWGTQQDMLAPEIFEQLAEENSVVRVNLLTDMWSVAIANHYLIFSLHPLFFVKELSRESITEYTNQFEWPEIDKSSHLFNQEMEIFYDWYCQVLPDLPKDIFDCFKYTVTKGYFNPELRTSYHQWTMKLHPLIAEEEKRNSFSKMKRKQEQQNEPEPVLESNTISETEYPNYISNLIKALIEKDTFLYEHKEELNDMEKSLNKPDIYNKVDKFLQTYYDIISDGVITTIETNKLKFQGRILGVKPDVVEYILNKPI